MKKKPSYKIIDFHSHILPEADHGSDSVETSLAQLELLKKAGVDIVVATSHFYPHKESVEEFLERRDRAAKALLAQKPDDIEIALGAEVYCVAGLEELEGLERLTVKGTNTLLLEMPLSFWNNNIIDTVFALDERFDLVLAHIDRYPSNSLEKLLYTGMKAQINGANSIRSQNKSRVSQWLGEESLWALGSDLHGADKATADGFKKLVKILGRNAEEIFLRTEKLIEGAEFI